MYFPATAEAEPITSRIARVTRVFNTGGAKSLDVITSIARRVTRGWAGIPGNARMLTVPQGNCPKADDPNIV
jgi:hypothetical protein